MAYFILRVAYQNGLFFRARLHTLKTTNTPIGVATYSLHDSLPESLKSLLPSLDEIARIVHGFDDEDSGVGLLGLGLYRDDLFSMWNTQAFRKLPPLV